LLGRELAMAESMAAKGLMSEVEVMRVRRQVNDLSLQTQERINRFRQEASAELVKRAQPNWRMQEEQMVVRDDMLRRTTLVSPVRGLVKQIRANTLGGVVSGGCAGDGDRAAGRAVCWSSCASSPPTSGLSRWASRWRSSSAPMTTRSMAASRHGA
jgi:hypothetical protein